MKPIPKILAAASVTMLTSLPVLAHELWLDGQAYYVAPDAKIVSDIRVGENFKGSSFSFNPNEFVRFDIALGNQVSPIEGRLGDRPAVSVDPLGEGLNVLIHQSKVQSVFYREWEKFLSFADHKDFGDVQSRHDKAGFPREKFREAYARFAKSLIAVGSGQGNDRASGLETEIIALENPYTDDMSDGIDIKLVYREMPRVGAQIEVFEKTPGEEEVTVFTIKTDDNGIATIPVKANHIYQLDAVVLRSDLSAKAKEFGAVWETLWANLTFSVPG